MAAVDANDRTVLIEGCGNPPIVGYTYCRVSEGPASGMSLSIVAPPAKCAGPDACSTYTIFFPNGTPSLGGAIPQGETRARIAWTALLGRADFVKDDRGFWGVQLVTRWTGPDGKEYRTVAEGEIRLRVVPASYVPLDRVAESPAFGWVWTEAPNIFKVTTSGRAYTGPR